MEEIYLHQWVDCRDKYNNWYEAQIIDISASSNRNIKVHYKGWSSKFDTWINLNNQPERIRLLHTFTDKPAILGQLDQYKIGTKCDCLDSSNKWYQAEIVDINENRELIKIHYKRWHEKYDEWINKNSYRIAPLHTKTTSTTTKNKGDHHNSSVPVNKITATSVSGSANDINNDDITNMISKDDINKPSQIEPQTSEIKEETDVFIADTNKNTKEQIQSLILKEEEFKSKLAVKGLTITSMGEDGNCLFRSISHQVYGTEDFHLILRQKCVQYIQYEYEYFNSYVPGGHDKDIFDAHCKKMSRNGVWGDNLEIQAFSEIYNRCIEIYEYNDIPSNRFDVKNDDNKNKVNKLPPIRLSYHNKRHYNSIINQQLHGQYILDKSKVGQIEDEKIQLSYLRSIGASKTTMKISDIEATDLEYFKHALSESRKIFEDNNLNETEAINGEMDVAINQSLVEYEKNEIENAMQNSVNDMVGNEVIQSVVNRGYSIDKATMAYSIYEGQQHQIPQQTLIQRIIHHIDSTEKAWMFGYMQ